MMMIQNHIAKSGLDFFSHHLQQEIKEYRIKSISNIIWLCLYYMYVWNTCKNSCMFI